MVGLVLGHLDKNGRQLKGRKYLDYMSCQVNIITFRMGRGGKRGGDNATKTYGERETRWGGGGCGPPAPTRGESCLTTYHHTFSQNASHQYEHDTKGGPDAREQTMQDGQEGKRTRSPALNMDAKDCTVFFISTHQLRTKHKHILTGAISFRLLVIQSVIIVGIYLEGNLQELPYLTSESQAVFYGFQQSCVL